MKNQSGGGISFIGMLQITFIVLKLTGTITWNWGWILAPIWMSTCLGVLILVIFGIIYLIIKS